MKAIKGAFAASLVKAEEKCLALVLSGGGASGAYEAGYFWGLINNDPDGQYQYDAISGVSAGSINALAIAAWPKG